MTNKEKLKEVLYVKLFKQEMTEGQKKETIGRAIDIAYDMASRECEMEQWLKNLGDLFFE